MVQLHLKQREVEIKDLDLEVYGVGVEEFETLMRKLGAKGVGKSFFVYKWRENIDISLPRVESKIARGHRGFRVEVAKEEREASLRRDFRMNALMLDIFEGRLLDFWGGIEDIKKRRIRIIDSQKFREDSLRILRAMQFSARFGYKISRESVKVMREIELKDLSKERIFWEFEKMFKGKYLHYGLFALQRMEIDKKVFNFKMDRSFFFKSALELAREVKNFQPQLYKFYFLYFLAKNLHKSFETLLNPLHPPKEYYKLFKNQKFLPKYRSDRFLAGLALRYPLSRWLGNYKEDIRVRAKRFGFWERKLELVKASEVIQEGFKGKEIGEEIRRRELEILRQRFKR